MPAGEEWVTEIGLCFTAKLTTPILTPELQSKQGCKRRGRAAGKGLSACLMFVNGARPAWQSVRSQCGIIVAVSIVSGQDKCVSMLL